MTDLVPPGHHQALFVLAGDRDQYRVVDPGVRADSQLARR